MFTPPNMSHVMCHVLRVTCHVSHVTCHLSPVTCQIFFYFYILLIFFFFFFTLKKFDKVVELIGGGSVINGAYTVYFSSITNSQIRVCIYVFPVVMDLPPFPYFPLSPTADNHHPIHSLQPHQPAGYPAPLIMIFSKKKNSLQFKHVMVNYS